MKTVSLEMWQIYYKEATNELLLFVNPYDRNAVLFSLTPANINSFLEKVLTEGQKRFVMNGQPLIPITTIVEYEETDIFGEEEVVRFNYEVTADNLIPFRSGEETSFSVEFPDEWSRRMLASDLMEHPATDWMTLPQ